MTRSAGNGASGKSPKRCQWQKKRGGFEEVPRLAATIVAGNRLARRWAGCHGEAVTEGSTHRTHCYANASGGALSVTSDRKYPKNAAKTNGFGFLARAWCGEHRDLLPRELNGATPSRAFALSLRLSTATRSALVLPVQTGKIRGSTARRDVGIAPYEILSPYAA